MLKKCIKEANKNQLEQSLLKIICNTGEFEIRNVKSHLDADCINESCSKPLVNIQCSTVQPSVQYDEKSVNACDL